jgi:hypothetical protein
MKVPQVDIDETLDREPHLRNIQFEPTSPQDDAYNCVAWALHRQDLHLWPSGSAFRSRSQTSNAASEVLYWPEETDLETVDVFERFFALDVHGYHRLRRPDVSYRPGVDKIALYVWSLDGGVEHVARQLHEPEARRGWWSSKLGSMIDLAHRRAADLVSDGGGLVVLSRPRKPAGWKSPLFPRPLPRHQTGRGQGEG